MDEKIKILGFAGSLRKIKDLLEALVVWTRRLEPTRAASC
jgi:hypothetical protein